MTEHHLPAELPVPRDQVRRVSEGNFGFDEAVGWIRDFVAQRRRHPQRSEYERVLRKYSLYRQLADKMGRGLWRDVYSIGQRLAELDPLDPSGSIARGRAMREMGNFPGAIRFYQQALDLTPFNSTAFPEMAATCRVIGQPGRFRAALDKARQELGDTHPLTIEGRIQLGELVRVYADPTDPATVAHIPRELYLQNVESRLDEMNFQPQEALQVGQHMLQDDMPELADSIIERCRQEFGDCAELQLLMGMVEHYRLNHAEAERHLRRAIAQDDSGFARMELGKIILERAQQLERSDDRRDLEEAGRQELRLAVDRSPELVEALGLLVERGWSDGVEGVVRELAPLMKAYPHAWSVWRVQGDAYAAEQQYDKAIESYQRGLACGQGAAADGLLLPCLNALEHANRRDEMATLAKGITEIEHRDPQLRWKVAQILCEHQHLDEARKTLQSLVDDEQVPPPLRQRADDVLDHLDDIERQQFKGETKPGKAGKSARK